MQSEKKTKFSLTNNQLKIIAMVTMLIDHIGEMLFPELIILKIIGRLSFPIFAYMIAEGCLYTRNRAKYLGLIAVMAIAFQVVYYIFMNSLYMGVLITFSLSIITIYSIDSFINKSSAKKCFFAVVGILIVLTFSIVFPLTINDQGYLLDYTVFGVAIPVVIYYSKGKWFKLISATLTLLLLSIYYGGIQYFSLISILLLALYNGQRGKARLKYAFYVFYPLHIVILYAIQIIFFM